MKKNISTQPVTHGKQLYRNATCGHHGPLIDILKKRINCQFIGNIIVLFMNDSEELGSIHLRWIISNIIFTLVLTFRS